MEPEQQQLSTAELFVKAIVGLPRHLLSNFTGLLFAILTDWETLILLVGAGLIAYATDAYLLVGGAILIVYSLLRVYGGITREQTLATGLLGRVIRDNPELLAGEKHVAITQLPAVLVASPPEPEEELEDVGT